MPEYQASFIVRELDKFRILDWKRASHATRGRETLTVKPGRPKNVPFFSSISFFSLVVWCRDHARLRREGLRRSIVNGRWLERSGKAAAAVAAFVRAVLLSFCAADCGWSPLAASSEKKASSALATLGEVPATRALCSVCTGPRRDHRPMRGGAADAAQRPP